jgi:hypothetical protein
MATNKNQHFVPRCHLKPFTLNIEGLSLSLFNLDRKKLIKNAPVKNQCSRDYFYGTDDQLESAIQLIESSYSEKLRDVIKNARSLNDDNKDIFKIFWLFQHLRTEAAALRAVEMSGAVRDIANLPPGEFSFEIKEAVQFACSTFADSMHLIDDLKFCVVRNRSGVPFITSDNPAVLTSKWHLEKHRTDFGIGSAGILAIIPLTPKLLFLGYDGDVYSVPNEKGIVEIKSDRDAIAFNRHQFLQCSANVYPGDEIEEERLFEQYLAVISERPEARHTIVYAELDGIEDGHKRYKVIKPEERDERTEAIIHSQVVHPNPLIWPSQIKVRSNGAVYTNDTGLGYIRASRAATMLDGTFRKERP